MACCGGQRGERDVLDNTDEPTIPRNDNLRESSLSIAGIEPVIHKSRDAKKDEVVAQRTSAYNVLANAPSPLKREKTRIAGPRSSFVLQKRMSRIGTMRRGNLVQGMEQASKQPVQMVRGPSIGTAESLLTRLESLGLTSVEMVGDGNCQFRAVADQLFGSQEQHKFTRSVAIAHMRAHSDFFGIYFESQAEFAKYMRDMARSRTWGDELTLRACVEAFGCVAHVVTSESANWYLVYTPESPPDDSALAKTCAAQGLAPPRSRKEIFINYISPIHYNAIEAAVEGPPAR